MSLPSFNLTRARSALGSPNRKTDDWAPTTPRPAVSIVGNVRFCPQAVTVGGPATARSVTERATAGSVPAPVTELRGSASFEHSRDISSDQLIWCTRCALRMLPHMPMSGCLKTP